MLGFEPFPDYYQPENPPFEVFNSDEIGCDL